MARVQVLVATSVNSGGHNIQVCDVNTGNTLNTYKPQQGLTHVSRHCIDVIGDNYLLCSYHDTPVMAVWCLEKKDRLYKKMILPSEVTALAVSPDGHYCIAALGPKIYIWQICSGYLLAVLDKHYQAVTCIRIASDLSYFVTGGDDGFVLVWSLAQVTTPASTFSVVEGQSSQFDPLWRIANSSSKITDIHLTEGGIRARFAVSSGQTVKVYELVSGQLLAVVSLDCQVECVVMERSEHSLFCGAANGHIYQCTLAHTSPAHSSTAPVDLTSAHPDPTFTGHTAAVSCLSVSIDGHSLVSGSHDQSIKVWHVASGQCMRTITSPGVVTNLLLHPALSSLFQLDQLGSQSVTLDSTDVDVSLVTSNGKSLTDQLDQLLSHSSKLDSSIAAMSNPPISVSAFKWEVFSALDDTRLTSAKSGQVDPFEQGSCFVRNPASISASSPWKFSTVPTEEDIDRIFNDVWPNSAECAETEESVPSKEGESETNGPLVELDDDHSLRARCERLKQVNQQLFNYSLEKFFSDLL